MKPFASALAILAILATCITLPSCGGGGGGGGTDSSPATIRPKTMDGIFLTLDNNVLLQFIRGDGQAPALTSGQVETGTFIYTQGGVQRRQYFNTFGTISDTQYPDLLITTTYSYRAINEASGILTLFALPSNDLTFTGTFNAANGSFVFLFESDSNAIANNNVEIDLTFTAGETVIASNDAVVRIPGGHPEFDTIIVPARVSLVAGGDVPRNYNPTDDPNLPSLIAAATLNNKLLSFTNGIPDPALNFTIQFTKDNSFLGDALIDEIGFGILRVGGVAADFALDYTYKRTNGTDDAVLVLSNIPAPNDTFNGRYTLRFLGLDNGLYIGEAPNAADKSGTFLIPLP